MPAPHAVQAGPPTGQAVTVRHHPGGTVLLRPVCRRSANLVRPQSKNAKSSSPRATSCPSRRAARDCASPAGFCATNGNPPVPTAQAIETAVAELLSDPAQAELAERQMDVA